MEPRIVTLDEFFVVGVGVDYQTNDISGVGSLWEKLIPRLGEIEGSLGVCGVCSYFGVEGGFFYVVGCRVGDIVEAPTGMDVWKVAAQRYLVSGFHGTPKRLVKKWQIAVNTYLQKAGVEAMLDGPWVEMYAGNCPDPNADTVTCDLYTPILG